MINKTGLLCLLLFIAGCASPGVRTEFNPVCRFGAEQGYKRIVNSPGDIAVYLKSSPNGFTLKENELKVREGYKHVILGVLKAYYNMGTGCCASSINLPKPRINTIEALQRAAYERGANAVVYCLTNISDRPNPIEREYARSGPYGAGWAVIVNGVDF